MKEVSNSEFFNYIGKRNVCIKFPPDYIFPGTTLFVEKHKEIVLGKTVDCYKNGILHNYPIETKYYIAVD